MNGHCSHEDRFGDLDEICAALESLWTDDSTGLRLFAERVADAVDGATTRDIWHDGAVKVLCQADPGALCRPCLPAYFYVVIRNSGIDATRRCARRATVATDPVELIQMVESTPTIRDPFAFDEELGPEAIALRNIALDEIRSLGERATWLVAQRTHETPRITRIQWEALRRHATWLRDASARIDLERSERVYASKARRALNPLFTSIIREATGQSVDLDPHGVAVVLEMWGLLERSWDDLHEMADANAAA